MRLIPHPILDVATKIEALSAPLMDGRNVINVSLTLCNCRCDYYIVLGDMTKVEYAFATRAPL